MESNFDLLLNIFVVCFLVLVNGFFVAVEFAIVRSNPSTLKARENIKKYGTRASLALVNELDLNLSATQFGITLASLVLGWWGEQTFHVVFLSLFDFLGDSFALVASHSFATVLAFALVAFLHVVLGELVARAIAIHNPEVTLRLLAAPMLAFTQTCRPIISLFKFSATLCLRLVGIQAQAEFERVHSASDLAMLVSQSTEFGAIDKDEEQMFRGVFGFSDTVAREVMTPRTDLVCMNLDVPFKEVLETIVSSGYSRFPVVGERVDDIEGILLAKDFLPTIPKYVECSGAGFSVKSMLREPYFIPGTKPIDDLLNEFKTRKLHMAIVLDEHGGVDGIVTLEDLIEEIVGEIFDESDIETDEEIVRDGNGETIVDGGVLVEEINSKLKIEIPTGDYDTVAGFIFTSLGRMPEQGDRIVLCDNGELVVNGEIEPMLEQAEKDEKEEEEVTPPMILLTVEEVANNRIELVRLRQFGSLEQSETETQESASEEQ